MYKPLRILMILDAPWSQDFGMPQAYMELTRQMRNLGHTVDKFSLEDAFPNVNRLESFFNEARFPAKVLKFVRQNAKEYDIIQSQLGSFPFSRQEMGYDGLLVTRSDGLPHFYHQFNRFAAERWPEDRRKGSLAGRFLRWLATSGFDQLNRVNLSLQHF